MDEDLKVSIPERDFSTFQLEYYSISGCMEDVSIPERDFSTFQPGRIHGAKRSQYPVSIPERDFSTFQRDMGVGLGGQ